VFISSEKMSYFSQQSIFGDISNWSTMTHRLEELFSGDKDVPSFYIDSVFTEVIFKEPVLCSGKIYEKKKLLEWIKENRTDPITREEISIHDVQIIHKSSIGLDNFMTFKVKNVRKNIF
jgi:hypothetical protein